jgi:hypothetical protein
MTTATEIIVERAAVHGDFARRAEFAQRLKSQFVAHPGWQNLSPAQRETLESVLTKMSRIMCGDAAHPDHWIDGAGYFELAYHATMAAKAASLRPALQPRPDAFPRGPAPAQMAQRFSSATRDDAATR